MMGCFSMFSFLSRATRIANAAIFVPKIWPAKIIIFNRNILLI